MEHSVRCVKVNELPLVVFFFLSSRLECIQGSGNGAQLHFYYPSDLYSPSF